MSAYTVIQTRIVSREHLVQALKEMGFEQVEVHARPVPLQGFEGTARQNKAEVVIRRQHISSLSNDIGFARDAQGFYRAIISDFDRNRFGTPWLMKLNQRYACQVAKQQLQAQGFELVEEQLDQQQTVRMTLRRAL